MLSGKDSFTSFSVKDLKEAKEFYIDMLGLEVMFEMGEHATSFKTGNSGFNIYVKPDHEPARYTVLNFMVEDLEAEVKELSENGVKFEIYDEMDQDEMGIAGDEEGMMAWFEDPSGNIIGLRENF